MLTQTAVFGAGGTFTGRVERVIDGDTIIVRASLPEVELHRIRLGTRAGGAGDPTDLPSARLRQARGQAISVPSPVTRFRYQVARGGIQRGEAEPRKCGQIGHFDTYF